jgi:large subunit ribosomal protein L19e
MKLKVQRRLAAAVLRCSPKRVWFDEERLDDIKEAITKQDLKGLVIDGAIRPKPIKSISRGRARHKKRQKSKGMQKGHGSRKGGHNARNPGKKAWMAKIRVQRSFIKILRDKKYIDTTLYRDLYLKSKGGFFRSKRHIKLYLEEHNLLKPQDAKKLQPEEKKQEQTPKPKRKPKAKAETKAEKTEQ